MVGGGAREHFVFPACENANFDFEHHQKTFRTAWRTLVKATAKRAGIPQRRKHRRPEPILKPRAAVRSSLSPGSGSMTYAINPSPKWLKPGSPKAAMQSIAGHLSKKMLDHYSHVRLAAKWQAVEALGGGLIMPEPGVHDAKGKAN